eukprot:CAMPEP_0201489632 /NCGR_PEP_ID=MMETSP0151_2-20130828/23083_1 /ASSEMBLY_ACC=CAM_ASM_000257 /TAXON_ID=200890 /ORGANISM="Paramoeba atlantica, Strain 621/1 / CCAP 1560/9" /LENGTH=306 /DNA_ID=CAMNT_0047875285 /DNA_START=65 /DNA_END=985 /DNA_ORIENTATION=-
MADDKGTKTARRAPARMGMLKGKLSSTNNIFGLTKEKKKSDLFSSFDSGDSVSLPNVVCMKGNVALKKAQKKKMKWAVVTPSEITLYENDKESEEHLRRTMVILSGMEIIRDDLSLTFRFFTEKEFTLCFETLEDLIQWAVCFDSILSNGYKRVLLRPEEKREFLEIMNGAYSKGGIAKCLCENEEEWQYHGGCLSFQDPSSGGTYSWDGLELMPKGEDTAKTLTASWDGSLIRILKNFSVVARYFYVPESKEYICLDNESRSWKWTRHFLANKENKGASWLMEGSVPHPIFMILQGFRYVNGIDL